MALFAHLCPGVETLFQHHFSMLNSERDSLALISPAQHFHDTAGGDSLLEGFEDADCR